MVALALSVRAGTIYCNTGFVLIADHLCLAGLHVLSDISNLMCYRRANADETRAHAGTVEVCCSTCWSSGVFLSVAERLGSIAGTGPVRCAAITSDSMTECVESPSIAEVLWSDRQYSWIDAPAGMLDGDWTYVQTPLEVSAGAPCPHEGGFRGTIATEAVLAICCGASSHFLSG